jgi:uncharacterized SAM-binding protein YcdF (DUF218 family)
MNYQKLTTPTFLSCALGLLCSYDTSSNSDKKIEKLKKAGMYDVIIVPGVPYNVPAFKTVLKARILWAKYLLEHNYAKNIIFSGSSVYTPYVEGEIMKIYADSLHIPSDHTFSETKAEHSTENIYYSLQMAKKMGFKKIAVATDQYQALIIKSFMKDKCPEIKIIPINYEKINMRNVPWPTIDPSTAHVNGFVSLVEREGHLKRFRGTLGRNINYEGTNIPAPRKKHHRIHWRGRVSP